MQCVCWVSELRFRLWAGQSSWGLTEGQCRNSQHSKNCVSLSLCQKSKSREVNKRFVPEQPVITVLVFRMHMYILVLCYRYSIPLSMEGGKIMNSYTVLL